MSFRKFALRLFVFVLFSTSYALHAQDIEKLRAEAEEVFNMGNAGKALNMSQKILQQTEKKYGKGSAEYALVLKDHSAYQFYNNLVDEAITSSMKSLEIYTQVKGKKSKEYVEALSNYAGIMYGLGEYQKAEDSFRECKTILVQLGEKETQDYGIIVNNLAELQRGSGKLDEAEKSYLEAMSVFQKINIQNSIEYASLLNNIANLYHDRSDYLTAREYYEKALERYEGLEGKESPEYSNCYKNYGVLLSDMGKYDEALSIFIKVTKNFLKAHGESSIEYASCLNDQANTYYKFGNYKRAEELYLRTVEIKAKHKATDFTSYCTTQNNLALLYGKLGNYSKGISLLESVLTEMKSKGTEKTPQYANYLNSLASLQEENEDFAKAEQNFKQSLLLHKEIFGTENPDYSRLLNNLALHYSKRKKHDKAEEFYLESIAIQERSAEADKKELAITYNNLGELYSVQNDFSRAEELFKKCIQINKEILGEKHPISNQFLSNLALLYYRWGKYDKVLELEKKVLDQNLLLLYDNFSFLSEQEKITYWKRAGDNFQFFNSFCLNAVKTYPHLASEMFEYNLETKSLILNHTSLIKKKIGEGKDTYLKARFKMWQEKRELLAAYYNLRKSELAKKGVDIEKLEDEVNQIEKELVTASSEFSQLRNPKRNTWKEVRDKLKESEAVVEILRVQQFENEWKDSIVYVALIITKQCTDSPYMVILPDGNRMERKYYKTYINGVKFDKMSPELYNVYWKEIDKRLGGKNIIYVSPSGIYNKISLPSLKMPDGKYLLESKQIQIMPGLKNLLAYKPVPNSTNQAVLFGYPNYNLDLNSLYQKDSVYQNVQMGGDPLEEIERGFVLNELPGTKIEVEKVSDILVPSGLKVQKYLGNDALESKLKTVQNPKVLHIATHGFFMKDEDLQGEGTDLTFNAEKALTNPLLRSGVLLAGANYSLANRTSINAPEDGILTAYEAMHFDLSETELVILSACETGLGEELNGEGVLGLQRSFQIAGAKNVLMSLWTVSDQGTQELMRLFYEHWIKDKNVSSAFRKAQLDLMKKYPSPYYWGAFVVVGVN